MFAARHYDEPRPGYFKIRAWSRGPWLPARIARPCACTVTAGDHDWAESCDRHPPLRAEIAGVEVPVERVWLSGREIDRIEYLALRTPARTDFLHSPLPF